MQALDEEHNPFADYADYVQKKEEELAQKQLVSVKNWFLCFMIYTNDVFFYLEKTNCEAGTI